MSLKHETTIYTDGACSGNPGPGGWASIVLSGSKERLLRGGDAHTTNNRMELIGVIEALRCLRGEHIVTIFSDSQYVVNAFQKGWLESWKKSGWTRNGQELKNTDLWQELDGLVSKHECKFVWVKGHAGNKFNEICDQVAVQESFKYSGACSRENRAEAETPKPAEPAPEKKEHKSRSTTSVPTERYNAALRLLDEGLVAGNMAAYGVERPCGSFTHCQECDFNNGPYPCARTLVNFELRGGRQ